MPRIAVSHRLAALSLSLSVSLPACAGGSSSAPPPTEPVAPASSEPAPADPVDTAEEASVKPGINDAWKGEDIDPLVERLESETREVYAQRERLAALVGAESGQVVADVGSGSGFLTVELARAVGPEGKVYAVDINQKLLDKVGARAEKTGVTNIETVLTPENGLALPPASVDVMFICDTYHHFEFPKTILASIVEALRPGAELVVVDFDRVEGETEDWIMEHVRAGKDEVVAEITQAGLELVEEPETPWLEQNYVLRFRKPS